MIANLRVTGRRVRRGDVVLYHSVRFGIGDTRRRRHCCWRRAGGNAVMSTTCLTRKLWEKKSKRKTPRIEIGDDPTFDGIPRERYGLYASRCCWNQEAEVLTIIILLLSPKTDRWWTHDEIRSSKKKFTIYDVYPTAIESEPAH